LVWVRRIPKSINGALGVLSRVLNAAAEWDVDIDFKRKCLVAQRSLWKGKPDVPKGGRSRTVPMTKRLAAALQELRHLRGARVFYGDDGEPITEGTVNEWLTPVLKRAGFAATRRVHILCHAFSPHLAMRGAPAPAIQELAGHTDLAATCTPPRRLSTTRSDCSTIAASGGRAAVRRKETRTESTR